MAGRRVTVNRAFASYAGDGSGEQRHFTNQNAHEIEGFVSADEFEYRQEGDDPFITVEEEVELPPREFQRPEVVVEDEAPATTSRRRARRTSHSEE